jgi:ATP-binding cassette subfamily B protein/subfamily B ATP-binding cassette protein MsbA
LGKFAAPRWKGLAGVLALMLLAAGLQALKPWPLKILVDHVFAQRVLPPSMAWLESLPGAETRGGLCAYLAAGTLLIFAATWAVQAVQSLLQSSVALRITYSLGAAVFEHLQRLSLRYHSRQPAGDLVRRVTRDSRCARDLVIDVLVPALTSLFTLGVMFMVMWRLDAVLTLAGLLVVPAMVFAQRRFYRPMTERSFEQQQLEGQLMSQTEQTLSAIQLVQAFRRERHEEARFRGTAADTLRAYFRCLAAQLKFQLSVNAATAVGRSALMLLGGWHVLDGSLTVGGLLVFLAYLSSLYEPLQTLSQLSVGLAATEASARRVFEVLDHQDFVTSSGESPQPSPEQCAAVAIRFDRVSFAYEAGRPVLHEIDLDIQPGERVALVGHTGAGKTTIVSLLMRFFDPTDGRITLGGVDLREMTPQSLRAQVSILLQDPFLLPVSIAENIAYGRPNATPEEIAAAASAAGADDFIRRLPQGYATVVGEAGATLSGGEKQRIAIARALLKDAPLLILDEPTSALDAVTEKQLMDSLGRLMSGRTTILIAHRMSTIRHAERIVVFDEGRKVEEGSERELLSHSGAYRRMHAIHVESFAPRSTSSVA